MTLCPGRRAVPAARRRRASAWRTADESSDCRAGFGDVSKYVWKVFWSLVLDIWCSLLLHKWVFNIFQWVSNGKCGDFYTETLPTNMGWLDGWWFMSVATWIANLPRLSLRNDETVQVTKSKGSKCRQHSYLVGIPTPLKNMSSSVGMITPNIWENTTCSSHRQPVIALTDAGDLWLWTMLNWDCNRKWQQ